ncbi:rhodanese-like domain-containing protein [bacterium SCSIO 12741]|nr:rhodanese-like domain-containing protein [bacterium SCSIO 12741]
MMYTNITPQEFRDKVANDDQAVLIDVRTPEEVQTGTIEGAINIDLMGTDFIEQISEMDKSKHYFMICRSGGRSSSACGAMAQMGFATLFNLDGGMLGWDGDVVTP